MTPLSDGSGAATKDDAANTDAPTTQHENDSHLTAEATVETEVARPYEAQADAILESKLGSPLPVPSGAKGPPPAGFTGANGATASGADVAEWAAHRGGDNIALRTAKDVVLIDRDDHKNEHAADTIKKLEDAGGPLPATVRVTSRADSDPISGAYFYRLPDGADQSRLSDPGPGVELIRHDHRYQVMGGSRHPEGGTYEYVHPDGTRTTPPHRDELPVLTTGHVEAMTKQSPPTAAPAAAADVKDDGDLDDEERAWRGRYLSAAIRDEVKKLDNLEAAKISDFTRNPSNYKGAPWEKTIYQVACNLLEIANTPGSGLTLEEAIELVRDHAPTDATWTAKDVEDKVRSARRTIGTKGRDLSTVTRNVDPFAKKAATTRTVEGSEISEVDQVSGLTEARYSDGVIVEGFARRYQGQIIYVDGLGWHRFTSYYRPVPDAIIIEMSRRYAASVVKEAVDKGDSVAVRMASRRLSAGAIVSVVGLAEGHELLKVDIDQLDAHPHLLACPNGYVDLRTGTLTPPDPAKLITKVTAVDYRPEAITHPDLLAARASLNPDSDEFVQERLGQALTGHTPSDDRIVIAHGRGENGKSLLLSSFKSALGDYAVTISERVILGGFEKAHPTEFMDLRGARFALLEELPDQANFSAKHAKNLAGTEIVKARKMRQDFVEFTASHSLFITTNTRPRITSTDHGMWRRFYLLPFPYTFVRTKEELVTPMHRMGDPGLRERMQRGREQREAILAWAVKGAVQHYQRDRVMSPPPESVEVATEAWRANSDPLGTFLAENVVPDSRSCIPSVTIHEAFCEYLTAKGLARWSDQTFVGRMEAHDFIANAGSEKKPVRIAERAGHGSRPTVSYPPEPVVHAYKDGQQITAWTGLAWRPKGAA